MSEKIEVDADTSSAKTAFQGLQAAAEGAFSGISSASRKLMDELGGIGRVMSAAASGVEALGGAMGPAGSAAAALAIAIGGVAAATVLITNSTASSISSLANLAAALDTTRDKAQGIKDAFENLGIENATGAIDRFAQKLDEGWSSVTERAAESAMKQEEAALRVEGALQKIIEAQNRLVQAQNAAAQSSGEWASKLSHDAINVQEARDKLAQQPEEQALRSRGDQQSVTDAAAGVRSASVNAELEPGREARTEAQDTLGVKSADLAERQAIANRDKDKSAQADLKDEAASLAVEQAKQSKKDAEAKKKEDVALAPIKAEAAKNAVPRAELAEQEAQFKQWKDSSSSVTEKESAQLAFADATRSLGNDQTNSGPAIQAALNKVPAAQQGVKEAQLAAQKAQIDQHKEEHTDLAKINGTLEKILDKIKDGDKEEAKKGLDDLYKDSKPSDIIKALQLEFNNNKAEMYKALSAIMQTASPDMQKALSREMGFRGLDADAVSRGFGSASAREDMEHGKAVGTDVDVSNADARIRANAEANRKLTDAKDTQGAGMLSRGAGGWWNRAKGYWAEQFNPSNNGRGELGYPAGNAPTWFGPPDVKPLTTTPPGGDGIGGVVQPPYPPPNPAQPGYNPTVQPGGWGQAAPQPQLQAPGQSLLQPLIDAIKGAVGGGDKDKRSDSGAGDSGLSKVAESASTAAGDLDKAGGAADGLASAAASAADALSKMASGTLTEGSTSGAWLGGLIRTFAGGGSVRGSGSGTSDSIMARLSNGEFVMRAAAVRAYGSDFMHSLNTMSLPGFAMGGPVLAGVRRAAAGFGGQGPGATLNLSIDGNQFNGLHAPAPVASALTKYAIGRQLSATGRKPSWMR